MEVLNWELIRLNEQEGKSNEAERGLAIGNSLDHKKREPWDKRGLVDWNAFQSQEENRLEAKIG